MGATVLHQQSPSRACNRSNFEVTHSPSAFRLMAAIGFGESALEP
jgi:hypothetical protein